MADGLLPADRRPGAELKAWSVVRGFATLALTSQGRIPAGRQRHEALESTLEFATLGLCSPPLPRPSPKARWGRIWPPIHRPSPTEGRRLTAAWRR
jgi:hypothetical protein